MRRRLRFESLESREMLAADVAVAGNVPVSDVSLGEVPSAICETDSNGTTESRMGGKTALCQRDGGGAEINVVEEDQKIVLAITTPATSGPGTVEVEYFGLRSNPFPFTKNISPPDGDADDPGAEVEFIEGDDGTLLSISLPNNGRIVREVGKKMVAGPGGGGGNNLGADVELIEGDNNTFLRITLPTGEVIIREVKKKIADPGAGDSHGVDVTLTTGTVVINERDGTALVQTEYNEEGTLIPIKNSSLLNGGRIEAGDEVNVLVTLGRGYPYGRIIYGSGVLHE